MHEGATGLQRTVDDGAEAREYPRLFAGLA